MEDGLGLSLSLSLKAFEKSPPPLASSSLKTTHYERSRINNSFFNKLDYFLKSPTQVIVGSKTSQQAPYTKLNLGWTESSSNTRNMKVDSTPKSHDDVVGKRSVAEREVVDSSDGGEKKKLRLSKEQATLLEQTFLEHSTLNNKQKLYLAKQLDLKPRQVEVWFQNRRARTKLKQTEVDCEYLRKYCEKLCDENKRLNKELQELRLCHVCNRASDGSGSRHAVVAAFSHPAAKPNVASLFSSKSNTLLGI